MLNTSESKNNNNKIKSVTNAPWISLTSASSVCFHTVKLLKKQGVSFLCHGNDEAPKLGMLM